MVLFSFRVLESTIWAVAQAEKSRREGGLISDSAEFSFPDPENWYFILRPQEIKSF